MEPFGKCESCTTFTIVTMAATQLPHPHFLQLTRTLRWTHIEPGKGPTRILAQSGTPPVFSTRGLNHKLSHMALVKQLWARVHNTTRNTTLSRTCFNHSVKPQNSPSRMPPHTSWYAVDHFLRKLILYQVSGPFCFKKPMCRFPNTNQLIFK